MKRTLLIGMSVLVCAAFLAIASTNEVTSVNVVGYVKKSVAPGLDLVASVFYSGQSNTLSEILGTNGTASYTPSLADCVYIYNPATLVYNTFWLDDGTYDPLLYRKWGDGNTPATVPVLPGQGFWLRNRGAGTNTYTLLGEVVDEAAITNVLVPGMQILSFPFSTDMAVGSLTCTNGAASYTPSLADCVYLFTPGDGYATYWLDDGTYEPTLYRKWGDGNQVATALMKAGQGFWYRSRSVTNVTWVQPRPYLNN